VEADELANHASFIDDESGDDESQPHWLEHGRIPASPIRQFKPIGAPILAGLYPPVLRRSDSVFATSANFVSELPVSSSR